MKTKTTAALSLLLCAAFALPTSALAGKGDRDPSTKDCPFADLSTRCSVELNAAYYLIDSLKTSTDVFKSRNGVQDAETLMCKISGAEIKLAQDKDDEASYLLYKVMEKIWSLEGQGKFEDAGTAIMDAVVAAKTCIDNP